MHFLQLVLAAGVADTLGLLLTLVWTAGFLPGFLDPAPSRCCWPSRFPAASLLLGKYVGVLGLRAGAGRAISSPAPGWRLAIRTGVWDAAYLLSMPLLLLHFAIFFSFSLLLAVCTRSTVVCVFGSIAFWGICWAINFGRHAVTAASDLTSQGSFSAPLVWLADVCYWLLPKPVDLGRLVFDALGAGLISARSLESTAAVSLPLSVLTSLLFTGYILLAACRQFAGTDY